jgi:hypothetical protein
MQQNGRYLLLNTIAIVVRAHVLRALATTMCAAHHQSLEFAQKHHLLLNVDED